MSECDWKIRFGTAGTSDSFEAKGYKSSLDIPAYTAEMGLDAFEYQCGHGRPPRGGQGREDGRRRRRAGHPVQRPRTLLYQYVQPRGRKAAG